MIREWTLPPLPGRQPAYLELAEAVREALRNGRLKPGEPLPSTRRLSEIAGLHRHTVMAAMGELVAEGWVLSDRKKYYRVCPTLPTRFFETRLGPDRPPSVPPFRFHLAQKPEGLPDLPPVEYRHSFQSGLPELRLFPFQEFKSHWMDALRRKGKKILGPGDPLGHPPFLEALDPYLRRVRHISGRTLMATHGSQEGIYLTARLLLKPGDHVAVEGLGYPSAWNVFKSAGARLEPIPLDGSGLKVDVLEKKLKGPSGRRIRLIYATPLHQYPTTVTLPVDRRLKLYALAVKYGVPILEDDYDYEYHYRSRPLAPLASQDPAGCVIYVSTFTKILFPGSRLGFLSLPSGLAEPFRRYRKLTTAYNDALLQETVARWIQSGGLERHLRRMRRVYEERRDALARSLAALAGKGVSFQLPDGGMSIWARTAVDTTKVFWKARSKGVFVLPEGLFTPGYKPGNGLRLGFANQTPEEIQRGISLLAPLLEKKA